MPTYEYFCEGCGEFSAIRSVPSRNEPGICPGCGAHAYRVMSAAPQLGLMEVSSRTAYQRNERAAHAPMTSAQFAATHQHGPGCGCGKVSKSTVRTADGGKAFPSKRPWMISH